MAVAGSLLTLFWLKLKFATMTSTTATRNNAAGSVFPARCHSDAGELVLHGLAGSTAFGNGDVLIFWATK